jgi:hypothetical protein
LRIALEPTNAAAGSQARIENHLLVELRRKTFLAVK